MKEIKTNTYIKYAKKYNPYAVCTESIGKTEGTTQRSNWGKGAEERYVRCKEHVEDQNEGETKPAREGLVHTPETEDEYVEQSRGERLSKPRRRPTLRFNPKKVTDNEWLKMLYPERTSSDKSVVIEAKKKK